MANKDNFTVDEVGIEKFTPKAKGNNKPKTFVVLVIPTGGGYGLRFGLKKAEAILNHIDNLKAFVESGGKEFE